LISAGGGRKLNGTEKVKLDVAVAYTPTAGTPAPSAGTNSSRHTGRAGVQEWIELMRENAEEGVHISRSSVSFVISCEWSTPQHKFVQGMSVYETEAGYPAPSRR
jgi:hypothetical protein